MFGIFEVVPHGRVIIVDALVLLARSAFKLIFIIMSMMVFMVVVMVVDIIYFEVKNIIIVGSIPKRLFSLIFL
jgi:hypothetical protein